MPGGSCSSAVDQLRRSACKAGWHDALLGVGTWSALLPLPPGGVGTFFASHHHAHWRQKSLRSAPFCGFVGVPRDKGAGIWGKDVVTEPGGRTHIYIQEITDSVPVSVRNCNPPLVCVHLFLLERSQH